MNAQTLTAIGGIVVPLLVLGAVPFLLAHQTRKRDAVLAEGLAAREAEAAERQKIKEQAERDAKAAASDDVSWEKINRALNAALQEERAAGRERLVEQHETFVRELERVKRLTDEDLGRVKAENDRMAGQIRRLELELARVPPSGGAA